jgi:hypothetical protein
LLQNASSDVIFAATVIQRSEVRPSQNHLARCCFGANTSGISITLKPSGHIRYGV